MVQSLLSRKLFNQANNEPEEIDLDEDMTIDVDDRDGEAGPVAREHISIAMLLNPEERTESMMENLIEDATPGGVTVVDGEGNEEDGQDQDVMMEEPLDVAGPDCTSSSDSNSAAPSTSVPHLQASTSSQIAPIFRSCHAKRPQEHHPDTPKPKKARWTIRQRAAREAGP